MGRFKGLGGLVALVAMLAAPSAASAATFDFTFPTTSAQGWQTVGTSECTTGVPQGATVDTTQGNPANSLVAVDNTQGAGSPPESCFWWALPPASSVQGNLKANYGGVIKYDVRPSGTSGNIAGQLAIVDDDGNALRAVGSDATPDSDVWTPYTFTILPSAPWSYQASGSPSATTATQANFFEVLEDVSYMQFLGDLVLNSSGQTTNIDNVSLTEGNLDSDADAVPDASDDCPLQAGGAPNGCPLPDGDGDGVPDANDQCPGQDGPSTNNGCPIDPDGDGLIGTADKCPSQSGPASNDGCPAGGNDAGDNRVCDKAKAKLKKAKAKLKKLRQRDAAKDKIKKAKKKVKRAKKRKRRVCAG